MTDRRISVCNRYRPFVTMLMIITVLLGYGLTTVALIRHEFSGTDRRIELLSVGMSESELVRVMGKPKRVVVIPPERVDMSDAVSKALIRKCKEAHLGLIEYEYVSRSTPGFISLGLDRYIILDQKKERVVDLGPLGVEYYPRDFDWADLLVPAALAACIALPWIGLKFWCKRRQYLR